MPIYLTDSSGGISGSIAATLSDVTSSMVGTSGVLPDIDGAINRALGNVTAIFQDAAGYPLTYATRGGSLNMYQTGTAAATDRIAIGLQDACHVIGFDSGTQVDTDPPASGYMSRVDGNAEILAANPTNSHYLCTYHNVTEAFDRTTPSRALFIKNYLDNLDGPGSDDGWAYNSANEKVLLFGFQYTINLSDYVAPFNGLTYPEWYADNLVQPAYIDPHIVAGIKIGGPGGINVMLDNHQLHSNKSGINWDNIGGNDDAQDYYDPEEATHVSTDAVAVLAYSAVRRNMRKGVERMWSNNPGLFVLTNTNQWADKPLDRQDKPESFAELRNCILEYRLSGATDQGYVHGGFSEGNSNNNFPRSGVYSDGSNAGTTGNWLQSYFNAYQSVRLCREPAIVPMSFWVQCLQSGVTGPGGKSTWSPVPASNAVWNMARWAMCTAWLCGAHASITGIQVTGNPLSTAGRAQSTPLFDEYGLINGSIDYGFGTGPTKLYKSWMGNPKEDPPTTVRADGSWGREFDNAYVIVNPDNDPLQASILIDVSALPGGASEWTRIVGSQDTVINNGVAATVDFNMSPVDGIVLARKSWYDAL